MYLVTYLLKNGIMEVILKYSFWKLQTMMMFFLERLQSHILQVHNIAQLKELIDDHLKSFTFLTSM